MKTKITYRDLVKMSPCYHPSESCDEPLPCNLECEQKEKEGERPETFQAFTGLTKREYFAAMAMQGLLAGHYEYFIGNSDVSEPSKVAKYAVFNADALIKELINSDHDKL